MRNYILYVVLLGLKLILINGINKKVSELESKQNFKKDQWRNFKACMEHRKRNLDPFGHLLPQAVSVLVTYHISLKCGICRKKFGTAKNSFKWEIASSENASFETLARAENIFFSSRTGDLEIFNANYENNGIFRCSFNGKLEQTYYLNVLSDDKIEEIHPQTARLRPYLTKPEIIPKYRLGISTLWSSWSKCSVCNKVGIRYKIGYCQIVPKGKILSDELKIFKKFKQGIPCESDLLPEHIKRIDSVKSKNTLFLKGFCKIPCRSTLFEILDANGNVLEKANNSAGIYSFAQELPPVRPPVKKDVVFVKTYDTIVIACPGKLNTDSIIWWKIGEKTVIPYLIKNDTEERITITVTNKIYIKSARLEDAKLYTCWQDDELVGTIQLYVDRHLGMLLNYHVMLIMIALILASFLIVCSKIVFGQDEKELMKSWEMSYNKRRLHLKN